jgi:tRNA(Ile)-lysidine synthase
MLKQPVTGLRTLVLATLRERALLDDARHVLVACSGGPDSQVLLHVLAALAPELGITLSAASVNHGLRPGAEADVALAGDLANELGVPFHALTVDVGAGASLQAQAREARYRALLACAAQHGAQCVAVGHTLDDQAETVLERLLRGTGIDGLAAIEPRRADGVIRPFIDAPRRLVRAYATAVGLVVANDPSNANPRFLRVRLRAQVLPALSAENPRVAQHLAALAEDARELRQLVAREAAQLLARLGGDFRALSEESRLLRRSALKQHVERVTGTALRRTHLVSLDRMLSAGGQVRLPGDFVASLSDEGELVLEKVAKRGRGRARPNEE